MRYNKRRAEIAIALNRNRLRFILRQIVARDSIPNPERIFSKDPGQGGGGGDSHKWNAGCRFLASLNDYIM